MLILREPHEECISHAGEGAGAVIGARLDAEFRSLGSRDKSTGPIEHKRDLPDLAGVGQRPFDRLPAFAFIAGNGVIKSQLEAALGRIGN